MVDGGLEMAALAGSKGFLSLLILSVLALMPNSIYSEPK